MFDIVVVLYEVSFKDSLTLNCLQKILTQHSFANLHKIYVIDNSQAAQQTKFTDPRFCYHYAGGNKGLAKAYNYVWPKSLASGCKWLVTLDQDTKVTLCYLKEMLSEMNTPDEKIVVIAPVIYNEQQQISPVSSTTLRPLAKALPNKNQTYEQGIMVINSGSVVALTFLAEIGGYNELFPLDYLDHWFCWKVFKERKNIRISSSTLVHHLSVLSNEYMTPQRYEKLLQAEALFFRNYQTKLAKSYHQQLILRGFKQLFKIKNKKIARLTFKYVCKKDSIEENNGD